MSNYHNLIQIPVSHLESVPEPTSLVHGCSDGVVTNSNLKSELIRSNLIQVKFVSNHCSSYLKCNFAMWNAQSINNKTTIICDYVISNKIDVMALSESWFYGDDREKEQSRISKTCFLTMTCITNLEYQEQ